MKPAFSVDLLAQVPTMTEALERSYRLGGLCDKAAASAVGIEYCHFQRMFRDTDSRHFPPDLIPEFLERCGNTFALEWLAWRLGLVVYPQEVMTVLMEIYKAVKGGEDMVRFSRALEAMFGEVDHGRE